MRRLVFASWMLGVSLACAEDMQEARYRTLIAELRCLVCQNQSLADSNAELAADMRREVRTLIGQGRSDDEIVQYLVARYGDFVRYRPPVKSTTWLLWVGPFVLLAIGAAVLVAHLRKARSEAGPLSEEEALRVRRLLDGGRDA